MTWAEIFVTLNIFLAIFCHGPGAHTTHAERQSQLPVPNNVGKLQIALLGRSGPSGVGCLTSVPVSPIRVPDNA